MPSAPVNKQRDYALFYLLILCLVVRAVAFVFSRNYDGDAVIRIIMAEKWLKDPSYIWNGQMVTWVFAPLYYYFVGLALTVWNNPLYAPRLVSFVFGVATMIPFYKLVKMQLGRKPAIFASVAFCFLTLQVRYSVVATSEAPGLFFDISAVYFFFAFLNVRRWTSLLLSALMVNFATMYRYESIVLVPVLGLVILLQDNPQSWRLRDLASVSRSQLLPVIAFGALSLVFLASRFAGDYIKTGDPLFSVPLGKASHAGMQASLRDAQGSVLHVLYNVVFFPGVSFLAYSPLVGILVFWGWGRSLYRREHLRMAAIGLFLLGVYIYAVAVSQSLAAWARFALPIAVFFLPFGGLAWSQLVDGLGRRASKAVSAVVVMVMVIYFTFLSVFAYPGVDALRDKLAMVSPLSRLEWYADDVITWTNKHAGSQDRILLDNYGFEHLQLCFYIDLPKENIKVAKSDLHVGPEFFESFRPDYVIYSRDGILGPILNLTLTDTPQFRMGSRFELCFATKRYWIFRISG